MIAREPILLVSILFTKQLSGYVVARHFFHVCRIRHIDDHEPIAVGSLGIFHAELIGPASVEVCVTATIVIIMMGTAARCTGAELTQLLRIARVSNIVRAYASQSRITRRLTVEFVVPAPVRMSGTRTRQGFSMCFHKNPFASGLLKGDRAAQSSAEVDYFRFKRLANIEPAVATGEHALFASRPHGHQRFAAGQLRPLNIGDNLHVADVLVTVQVIERAQGQPEWHATAFLHDPRVLCLCAHGASETH